MERGIVTMVSTHNNSSLDVINSQKQVRVKRKEEREAEVKI